MLNCIGAGTAGSQKSDYGAGWRASDLFLQTREELTELIPVSESSASFSDTPPRLGANSNFKFGATGPLVAPVRPSWFTATYMCILRMFRSYNRQPTYNLMRPGLCFIIGLVLASVFGRQDKSTIQGLLGAVCVIFLATIFIGQVDATPVIDVVFQEKPSFARERFAQMFPVSAYAVAWAIAEIPWVALHSVTFAVPFYFLSGYDPVFWKFAWFLLYHFLFNIWSCYLGQFLAGLSSTSQVGQLLLSTLVTLLVNFGGLTRQYHTLPTFWRFLYWALPSHYATEGMVVTQWYGTQDEVYFFGRAFGHPVNSWTIVDKVSGPDQSPPPLPTDCGGANEGPSQLMIIDDFFHPTLLLRCTSFGSQSAAGSSSTG
jgi:ABC-type multidrug transport system permease subunit